MPVSRIADRLDTPPSQRTLYWHLNRLLERYMPEGLYSRSLIIVIAPMVLLQSIMAYVFVDRHYEQVTKSMAQAFVRDIVLVVRSWEQSDKSPEAMQAVYDLANKDLALGLVFVTGDDLPPPNRKPLFSSLHPKLTRYIAGSLGKPFWLDTVGQTGYVDVRIKANDGVILRFLTDLDRTHVATTAIFLTWMAGSSLVLLAVAIVFLRNQIKPIVKLANAAQSFGMGRDVPNFRPDGAAEVQAAARAFLKMKQRIERHLEQRTAMLAGVSHDLRTVLTRFKLELALLPDGPTVRALGEDADEMQQMLEGYLAFVRGDGGEVAVTADVGAILEAVRDDLARSGEAVELDVPARLTAPIKPAAFKRCIANLAGNAARHGGRVVMAAQASNLDLTVTVDDDGPGIPAALREEVFKPFIRLDTARNQNESGTGLGLAIARDIAQSHGGDIVLADSPLGGLRATVKIPIQ